MNRHGIPAAWSHRPPQVVVNDEDWLREDGGALRGAVPAAVFGAGCLMALGYALGRAVALLLGWA